MIWRFLLVLLLATPCLAQIDMPDTIERDTMAMGRSDLDADVKRWKGPDALDIKQFNTVAIEDGSQKIDTVCVVTGPPGEYKIVLETITLLIDWEKQTKQILWADYEHTLTIEAGDTPPDPPIPPPVTKAVWGIIVEETANRTPKQGSLFVKLRMQVRDRRLEIVDQNQESSELQPYVNAALEDDDQLPVLVAIDKDGNVVNIVPLPDTVDQVKGVIGG